MNFLSSPYLLIPVGAWIVAQLSKYIFLSLRQRSLDNYSLLYKSGDMPSSHSAVMVSLLVTVGSKLGLDSALFGVVAIVTGIVLYDAVNVRRAVGEQGLVLRKLLKTAKDKDSFYNAKGHTLLEVIVGSLVGLLVALVLLQFL